jgi:hypothetical protein
MNGLRCLETESAQDVAFSSVGQGGYLHCLLFPAGLNHFIHPELTIAVDWLPMEGPIFGASGKINLAFYDALRSIGKRCGAVDMKDNFSARADQLKDSVLSHL